MAKYTPKQVDDYLSYVKKHSGDKYTPDQLMQYEDYVRMKNSDTTEKVLHVGMGALGKLADVLRPPVGALTGRAMELGTGKPAFTDSEGRPSMSPLHNIKEAYNPTNLTQFPGNSEMMARTGTPNPTLSELPGMDNIFADPAASNIPWYQPEKGGPLDFSLGGASEMATNPGTWVGPELSVAQKAISGGERPLMDMAKNAISMGTRPLVKASGINASKSLPAAMVRGAINPIGNVVEKFGAGMYSPNMLRVEHEGEKFGKSGVADSFYRAGVKSPLGLTSGADRILKRAGGLQGSRYAQAAAQGVRQNMGAAFSDVEQEINRLRSLGTASAMEDAARLENEISGVKIREAGTPDQPAVAPDIADEPHLDPWTEGRIIVRPGTPEVPGTPPNPYTPAQATAVKSNLTENAQYNESLKNPSVKRGYETAAGGIRRQVEDSVDNAIGDGVGTTADLNEAMGHALGTKRSQIATQQAAGTQAAKMRHLTGMDAVIAALGGLPAMALKKAVQAGQMLEMPTAYYTRKLGESGMLDRMISEMQQNEAQKRREKWQKP